MAVSELTQRAENLPDLLTRQQLADYTGVSVPTLARWAVDGDKGPRVTKLGHAVRYSREDVEQWIRESAK